MIIVFIFLSVIFVFLGFSSDSGLFWTSKVWAEFFVFDGAQPIQLLSSVSELDPDDFLLLLFFLFLFSFFPFVNENGQMEAVQNN